MKYNLSAATLLCLSGLVIAQVNSPLRNADDTSAPQMHLSIGVGAVTMDGETYQQVSLRPDVPLGNFGIGFDFTVFFDSDGTIRSKDWDEAADILDKIRYLRFGHPGDPLYFRAGALDDVTIGYGILMKHYSNSIEYPSVRRLGANWELQVAGFQIQGMINNFRELLEPGLLAIRASRSLSYNLNIGASLITDGNQFANLADSDNDDVPDELDHFPGDNDADVYEWLSALYQSNHAAYEGLRGQYPDWPEDPTAITPYYKPGKDPLTAVSLDVGYPLLDNKLHIYAQGAHFISHGSGITAPGIVFQPIPFLKMGIEYRYYTDEFIPEYFDRTYELSRYLVIVDTSGHACMQSRETSILTSAKAAQGVYGHIRFSILNLINTDLSYSSMHPVNEGNHTNSLFASAGLNMGRIPKITELSAYYFQSNVRTLFKLDARALPVWGYKIGYEISSGVNLLLNYRYTYQDLNGDGTISGSAEQIRTFSIETYFTVR